jgi:glutathione S-transferase
MGLLLAHQQVILRDINMKDKPQEMIAASSKSTVPVLLLEDTSVIDQSLDIMLWALTKNDPDNLLHNYQPDTLSSMLELIGRNDNKFVANLKRYKAAARYHDAEKDTHKQQCEVFIKHLEQLLNKHEFIMGDTLSLVDYAILPFIRQFSRVERQWYLQAPYPKLRNWLNSLYQQPVFTKTMVKHPKWVRSQTDILFGRV